jgi:hypothetical protein
VAVLEVVAVLVLVVVATVVAVFVLLEPHAASVSEASTT